MSRSVSHGIYPEHSEVFQMTLPCILMSSQDPAETQEKFYEDLPKYDSKNF
jgi:hypothetical protein